MSTSELFRVWPKYKPNESYFVNDMIAHDIGSQKGSVSRSFLLEAPDIRSASNTIKNNFHNQVNSALRVLHLSLKDTAFGNAQVYWNVNSDYRKFLKSYESDTEKYAKKKITVNARKERVERYRQKIKDRQLRLESCVISISLAVKDTVSSSLSEDEQYELYSKIFEAKKAALLNIYTKLDSILYNCGIRLHPLGDREHFVMLYTYFNPGIQGREYYDIYEKLLEREAYIRKYEDPGYRWQKESLQSLCCKSGITGNRKRTSLSEFGFMTDGCYNDIILIDGWGSNSDPGDFYELTSLPYHDYSISVNIYPKEKEKERKALISQIEDHKKEVRSSSKNETVNDTIESKSTRLKQITHNITMPFECHYIIRIWDNDLNKLTKKVGAIKSALEQMSGISYYELGNVATQRMFYYIGMPTWIFNTKKAYRVTAANTYLADRLPISSTYTGLLDGAEAIYDGGQWNLVGIKSFIKGTPQMTCVFGMQGSGKSLLMNDFIIQTDCFYDYTCIIEEGNTYGSTVSQLGEKTKIISPASDICMNYFDTEGAPIDNTQISFATSFVTRMCGDSKDEDKINLRRAMLNYYVQQIYDEKFTDWQKKNRELIYEIARRSIASWKYRHLYMPSGSEEIEGWVEFRDLLNLKAERAEELYSKVTEEEIAKFLINNKRALRNNAAAWYKPEDFPQHSDLYITIHSNPNLDEHSESDVKLLSTYLKEWCAGEGASGKMFDGTSNIKNECRIDHYELGMIRSFNVLKTFNSFSY